MPTDRGDTRGAAHRHGRARTRECDAMRLKESVCALSVTAPSAPRMRKSPREARDRATGSECQVGCVSCVRGNHYDRIIIRSDRASIDDANYARTGVTPASKR